MAELPTAVQITQLASLLAPGLLISAIRARAITGSVPDLKDRLLSYGVISTAYFAAVSPLFHVTGGIALQPWLWSVMQYFVFPVLLGIASAYLYQLRVSYRLAALGRLHLAHHLPASWDYAFAARSATAFLLVTLKDGSQVAGRWSEGSFASSSKDERDLLIGEMWQAADDGGWTALQPARSILISGGEIRHIEFFGG